MNEAKSDLEMQRVPSGILGLDRILGGGFLCGGVYIIQGSPGAGKTILANQACFQHAQDGGRAVYVTLLAESHSRMLQHLHSMQFFDEKIIPRSLYYVSAFRTLESQGLAGVVDLLRKEVKGQQATLLVLDGLVAVEETAQSDRELKKFIHELQSHAAASGCTVLLLTSGTRKEVHAEHTMVDGLIELEDQLFAQRSERSLRVAKFRGSDFVAGRHPFRITERGIVLSPRIEALYARASVPERIEGPRLPTGIEGLDRMLGGGLMRSSSTVLFGASGTGKTSIALHFASQARIDAPTMYCSFFESPQRLIEKARGIGIPLDALIQQGALEIEWQPQGEISIDRIAHTMLERVDERKIRRLVIDGMNAFIASALYPDRIGRFFSCLSNELRARGVTTLHTAETRDIVGGSLRVPLDGISALVDNLIFLRFVELDATLSRMVSVMKVRDSDFDHKIREFHVTSKGVRIGSSAPDAEGLLGGVTHRVQSGQAPQ